MGTYITPGISAWSDEKSKPAVASACSNSIGEDMSEERLPSGVSDFRAAFDLLMKQTEALEKQAHELGSIRATVMVNFGLNSPRRYDGIVVGHECKTHDAMVSVFRQYHDKVAIADERIANIRKAIEAIVIPEGEDAGVLLVSTESRTHTQPGVGLIYDNEFFTDMGEALVALWQMTK